MHQKISCPSPTNSFHLNPSTFATHSGHVMKNACATSSTKIASKLASRARKSIPHQCSKVVKGPFNTQISFRPGMLLVPQMVGGQHFQNIAILFQIKNDWMYFPVWVTFAHLGLVLESSERTNVGKFVAHHLSEEPRQKDTCKLTLDHCLVQTVSMSFCL